MSKTLVIRFSSMGDVALLVPVLFSVAKKYPDDIFTVVTRRAFVPIFAYHPDNVQVVTAHLGSEHKGLKGMSILIKDLLRRHFTRVADMHGVLRSQLITTIFRLKGKKVATIDKGRKEKRELVRKNNKQLIRLEPTVDRYYDVFTKLGYSFSMSFTTIYEYGKPNLGTLEPITGPKNETWIGIAPFAKHIGKTYPYERMKKVIATLGERRNVKVFLFGSREDAVHLAKWEKVSPSVFSVAGKFPLSKEIDLMSFLDVMVTMDSGNMHLASLVGTPVVSIWGATHPYAGFYGYNQSPSNSVQIDLPCRPCSVFGDKSCYRHNYECLNSIHSEMVIEKIDQVLNSKQVTSDK